MGKVVANQSAMEAKTADLGINKEIGCFQQILAGQTCKTSHTQIWITIARYGTLNVASLSTASKVRGLVKL